MHNWKRLDLCISDNFQKVAMLHLLAPLPDFFSLQGEKVVVYFFYSDEGGWAMTFSYFDYLFNTLLLPLAALVFIGGMAGVPLARRGLASLRGDRQMVVMLLVLVFIAVVLVLMVTQGGGIGLIGQGPGDAVTLEGTILDIREGSAFLSPRYSAYGELSNGYHLTIATSEEPVTVTVMARGDLQVGDQVTISWLPKSTFALSITRTE